MQTIKTGKGDFLFIELPNTECILFTYNMGYLIYKEPAYENWAKESDLVNYVKIEKYLKRVEGKDDFKQKVIKLPDGDFKFIGATKTHLADRHEAAQNITEEKAALIVDNNGLGCWDNYRLKRDEKYTCTSALDSFKCLLSASKLDETKEYAVLKFM